MADKVYIGGSIKEIGGQYGTFINCSLKLEDLQKIVNEKGYCNFVVSRRKEIGKFGDTHFATKNDYTPSTTNSVPKKEIDIQDIPFR